jgi:ferric-dicitrate binding protein FerR (iron transport regulator)
MNVTQELISRYADSEVTPEEARAVQEALGRDPALAAQLEEFSELAGLFGHDEAEPVSEALAEKLYAVGRTQPVEDFEAVPVEREPHNPWRLRWGALAAAILIAFGLLQLTYRPPVQVNGFVRQALDANGDVVSTERLEQVVMHAGDTVRAKEGERVSCRLPGGALVVLLGDSEMRIGDPREREVFELERGIALCTVAERKKPRYVHAGGYRIAADQAHFGVRVVRDVRTAGPALADAEVTVAVSRGSLEVTDNGLKETVRAGLRVVLKDGAAIAKDQAWRDELYVYMMRHLRVVGREVLPGYFTTEQGVSPISDYLWATDPDGARVHVLTPREGMETAHFLVLYARASRPTPLALTLVAPYKDARGKALATTIETPVVGTDWTVISIPRSVFVEPPEGMKVTRENRRIAEGRSFQRLELRPAAKDTTFELKSSLWAPRPPTPLHSKSEVVR